MKIKYPSMREYIRTWRIDNIKFWDLVWIYASAMAFGMFMMSWWGLAKLLPWWYYLGWSVFFMGLSLKKIKGIRK